MEEDEGLSIVRLQGVAEDLPSPLRDDVISLATVFNLSWSKFRGAGAERQGYEKRLVQTIRANWANIRISQNALIDQLEDSGATALAEEIGPFLDLGDDQDPGTGWLDHIELCSDWFELLEYLGLLAKSDDINSYYPVERAVRAIVTRWLCLGKGSPADKFKKFGDALKHMGCPDIEDFLPKYASKRIKDNAPAKLDKEEGAGKKHKTGPICSLYIPLSAEETTDYSCTLVDSNDVILPSDIQLLSNVICADVTFRDAVEDDPRQEDGVWLSLTHTGPTESTPTRMIGLYVYNVDGSWTAMPTEQFNVDCQGHCLILARLDPGCNTVAVISEPKKDRHIVSKQATILTSSVNPDVAITVPEDAFPEPANIEMQVEQPMVTKDTAHVVGLHGHSTVLQVTSDIDASKPLDFALPMSTIDKRKKKHAVPGQLYVAQRRGSGAWENLEGKRVSHLDQCACFQHIIEKSTRASGQGSSRDSTEQVNCVTTKYLVIEADADLSNREVEERAEALDDSSKMDVVSIIARPHFDRRLLYIELLRRDDVNDVIAGLEQRGFDDFPFPSEEFQIKDGESIEIKLKGEVRFSSGARSTTKVYHRNIRSTRIQEEIRFKERADRKDEDFFTCKVRAFLPVDPEVPLCSIPIQYPKVKTVHLNESLPSEAPDVLSDTETERLSRLSLKGSRASNSATRRFPMGSSYHRPPVTITLKTDEDVIEALKLAGLADDSYDGVESESQDVVRRPVSSKKKKSVKKKRPNTAPVASPYARIPGVLPAGAPPTTAYEVLSIMPSVTNQWQTLGRTLRVADKYISSIETALLPTPSRRLYQMLVLWQFFYKQTTVAKLRKGLTLAGMANAAERLQFYKIKRLL